MTGMRKTQPVSDNKRTQKSVNDTDTRNFIALNMKVWKERINPWNINILGLLWNYCVK